ncbi:hypothetical protein GCM10018965_031240 [Nonomuraea roseola]
MVPHNRKAAEMNRHLPAEWRGASGEPAWSRNVAGMERAQSGPNDTHDQASKAGRGVRAAVSRRAPPEVRGSW